MAYDSLKHGTASYSLPLPIVNKVLLENSNIQWSFPALSLSDTYISSESFFLDAHIFC